MNKNKIKFFIILTIEIICLLSLMIYIISYVYSIYAQKEVSKLLTTIEIELPEIIEKEQETTERMLQVQTLKEDYEDIIGWLEMDNTNINYPVLQCDDNTYYLNRNYKGEKVTGGSLFLDKDYDFDVPSSNLLIYGHRNKSDLMFEDLVKYKEEDFYLENTKFRFTTPEEDEEYEIFAIFNSRVYYTNETNVFRYYYFVNAENEIQFNEYVENCKKSSMYDIDITPEYGEQLITLSTCDYHVDNGRFVIVARKVIGK